MLKNYSHSTAQAGKKNSCVEMMKHQLRVFSYISPSSEFHRIIVLRSLCAMADAALRELQPRFSKLYAKHRKTIDRAGMKLRRRRTEDHLRM
jgi:hypothetical protein